MNTKYFIVEKNHFEELAKMRFEFKEENSNFEQDFITDYIQYLKIESGFNRIKVFCVEINNTIVGNINLILIPKSPTPGKIPNQIAYLTNTYVKGEFRNQKIGTGLLEQIEKYAKEQNIELIFVWPSEHSVSFYEREGFENENDILEKRI